MKGKEILKKIKKGDYAIDELDIVSELETTHHENVVLFSGVITLNINEKGVTLPFTAKTLINQSGDYDELEGDE